MNTKTTSASCATAVALCAFSVGLIPSTAVRAAQGPPVVVVAPAPIVIDDATPIKVRLQTEMKSGVAKEGDQVTFLVDEDVRDANGHIVIREGTPAFGRVLQSSHRGMLGKPGKLEFSCDYIAQPDGTHILLRNKKETKYGQDNRPADVAAAVLLSPVALLIKGNDVTARKGAEFTMYVDRRMNGDNGSASSAILPAQPTGRCSFLMNDGTSVVGVIAKFDGATYHIHADSGDRDLKASDVRTVSPVQ